MGITGKRVRKRESTAEVPPVKRKKLSKPGAAGQEEIRAKRYAMCRVIS
jgi:hypothetical protein